MSHVCPSGDRLAPRSTWCPTLGICQATRRADPTGPAAVCGGLVCAHGCQRADMHVTGQLAGYLRLVRDIVGGASANLPPWPCRNEPDQSPGFCLCCAPPPDAPFNVIQLDNYRGPDA